MKVLCELNPINITSGGTAENTLKAESGDDEQSTCGIVSSAPPFGSNVLSSQKSQE